VRICHLNEPGAGGSFGVMITLVEYAVSSGHEVHAIYSPDRADALMVERLLASGAHVHTSMMRRSVGPWDAGDGWRLRRLLNSLGHCDILHSHSSKAGALARTFGLRRGTAQIYSPHGFYTMTGEAPGYIAAVERMLSRVSDRIIAVSRFERDHALSLGIAPERVAVIPNGLRPGRPLGREEARAQLGLPQDAFVLGFVGRLEPQKDPLAAVAVMKALADTDIELAVIGDGELRDEAERAARDASPRIRFLGARNAKPLFSAFDALLCTSRYEGMPVAFLESLNAAVPIVSYPVGGTDELIEEGRTGFVVAPEPGRAAEAIRLLRSLQGGAREAIKEACLAKAAEHTDRTMGEATIALYRDALARRGRSVGA
jgi:glycosyltransferase involved in cell wall biosynthesis